MAAAMFRFKNIYIDLFDFLKSEDIPNDIFKLIKIVFQEETFSLEDEIFFGVLAFVAIFLLNRNYIVLDLEKDIENLKTQTLKDDPVYLHLKKCKFRCDAAFYYKKLIEEDYLFYFNLLDTIPNININPLLTRKFLKRRYDELKDNAD